MNYDQLVEQIKLKASFLCVGLDPDLDKIPKHLLAEEDPIFEFNKQIIDATKDYCVAYKPNIAFYESLGTKGWDSLAKTLDYIPKEHFTIADAKRGDIGNTASMYAKTFFETYSFDSITVAPYMGSDSVLPFLNFENKWAIILGLTSNAGASDFQEKKTEDGQLFELVLKTAKTWGSERNMMFVAGATQAKKFQTIRKHIPKHFLLVPGVGAQGGSLEEVAGYGITEDIGLLVNSSRGIIYAGKGENFQEDVKLASQQIQTKMKQILITKNLI